MSAVPSFNRHGVWAIYKFEMARALRTLLQSVVTPVITTSLYFVVFGSAIGSRVAEVNGVPSDQTTSGRRESVSVRPSALESTRSASHGSSSRVARLRRTRGPCVSSVTSPVVSSPETSPLNVGGAARIEAIN